MSGLRPTAGFAIDASLNVIFAFPILPADYAPHMATDPLSTDIREFTALHCQLSDLMLALSSIALASDGFSPCQQRGLESNDVQAQFDPRYKGAIFDLLDVLITKHGLLDNDGRCIVMAYIVMA